MDTQYYPFKETTLIEELPGCSCVYRHLTEPLVITKLQGDLQPLVTTTDWEQLRKNLDCQCLLLVSKSKEEFLLFFCSGTKEIRALEFLDTLLCEFGLVKGNAEYATGQISSAILQVQLANAEIPDAISYFLLKTASYFEDCDYIEAEEYGIRFKEEILSLPRYTKRREGFAYVKSLDIAAPKETLRIKTLENKSGMLLSASEETYIMIGCRGEVYDIKRETFENSYEATEEPLDVFEQMLDFIPAVENTDTGAYISLDSLAHICYPKPGAGIYARKLTKRTKIFPANSREYFYGRPGDYIATRSDDLRDSYIIQGEIFKDTYEAAN